MPDHDAAQPPTSDSPRPDQDDEFNARAALTDQDILDAACTGWQAPGQTPGAVPGVAPDAQAGSQHPTQPDLPAGPLLEEQTHASSTGATQAAAQPGAVPADPYIQVNPYAQQSELSQAGQPDQPGRSDSAVAGGFGGAQPGTAPTDPYIQANPYAQQGGLSQAGQPAQPAQGGSTATDGTALASSPFAQSAPGIPSAPGTFSTPAAGTAPSSKASRETPHWPGQQPQAQPAGLQDQQSFAQQPAPHSHPFSGGRQEGEVGISSVFPTATTRAEAKQATETFIPATT